MEKLSNNNVNNKLVETNIKIIGDKTIICQIVQLLAYIRHSLKNNNKDTIKVNIGNTIANSQFMFDVNGLEIPDFITQNTIEIS